jgi:DNA primase
VIPPSFVQELLARTDIAEVVGQHVQLRKGGANLMGLCPFHGEKSPSFSVSPAKQFYYCFGCGASGDALRFLTEHLGLSFVDAVHDLAQRAGLQVPDDERSPAERDRERAQRERQATLNEVLAKAGEHWRKQLKASPRAVDYLKKRGLTGEVAARFGLGYAPEGWRGLASVFPRYDDPLLAEAGLVKVQGDEGPEQKRYDYFRDRIMFPIRAVSGEVIGFGGRVLDQGEPKYLNSPETPVFVKGRELYGLFEARAALRERGYALVVEGYMDVVALAQLGFPNAVATLGTACTEDHVRKLLRFTDRIVFSFDGDAAGRRAAGRALEAALPHASDTRSLKFLFLPTEHDPDSFVREHGAEAFERCVEQAVPLSRQLVEAARVGCDLGSADARARLLANAKPMWAALPDGALRRQLLGELATLGHLGADDLRSLWGGAAAPRAVARPMPQAAPSRRLRSAPAAPADHVLRLLLSHGGWWEQLNADDHELLHGLPPPHGELLAWLERQLAEHGPAPWAAWREALRGDPLEAAALRLLPEAAPVDPDESPADLRQMVDRLWVEALKQEETRLIASAAGDPAALQRWREVHQRRLGLEAGRAAPPGLS